MIPWPSKRLCATEPTTSKLVALKAHIFFYNMLLWFKKPGIASLGTPQNVTLEDN